MLQAYCPLLALLPEQSLSPLCPASVLCCPTSQTGPLFPQCSPAARPRRRSSHQTKCSAVQICAWPAAAGCQAGTSTEAPLQCRPQTHSRCYQGALEAALLSCHQRTTKIKWRPVRPAHLCWPSSHHWCRTSRKRTKNPASISRSRLLLSLLLLLYKGCSRCRCAAHTSSSSYGAPASLAPCCRGFELLRPLLLFVALLLLLLPACCSADSNSSGRATMCGSEWNSCHKGGRIAGRQSCRLNNTCTAQVNISSALQCVNFSRGAVHCQLLPQHKPRDIRLHRVPQACVWQRSL